MARSADYRIDPAALEVQVVLLSMLVACSESGAPPAADLAAGAGVEPASAAAAGPKHAALFGVLPEAMYAGEAPPRALVDLGRMLYYETRLSKNQDVACNSCHLLDAWGVDGQPTSSGHKAQRGGRNSPTTYNAALHVAQFWDGRAATVEDQAKGPVLNPIEMAMPDEASVVKVLRSIPGYQTAFQAAFPGDPDPISYDHMAAAIGAFERGLVTRNSRFDRYLAGDAAALSPEEAEGLERFVSTGCTACHMGPAMGGGMYQKLGLVNAYPTADVGRMEVTKSEADRFLFKVPSLRNVAKTGPYFHDGSIATLDEAIRKMAHHQLGKDLTDAEVTSIRLFLESTTGELPTAYVARPELPPSGPDTPKADPS